MKKIIIFIILIGLSIFIYGYCINTHGYTITKNKINEPTLDDSYNNFKIVQFSDSLINDTNDINNLKNVANTINELNPDIVVFTGDLFNSNYKMDNDTIKKVTNILNDIKCNYYKYAIIGDNKYINNYSSIMNNAGFQVLDNEYVYLFNKSINPIKIIGLSTGNNNMDIYNDEEGINPIYTIVLTHYPDNINNINSKVNLVLAGHSLNGQVRLPFIGGLMKKEGANYYIDKYYNIDNIKLYISGGLGTEKIHFRLLNKPEINEYILEK